MLLYCASGNRSARAAAALQDLGYDNVASVAGGIVRWAEAGLPVVETESLTPEQRMRYSRHTLLPEIGVEGQVKLLDAKVLLIGAGGLGSPSALYLAAAGVGTIGIVDDDVVDETNLQRQVIHAIDRVGMPKTQSARRSIEALNPDVEVVEHEHAARRLQHPRDPRALRLDRRRRRQLPHPLPAQRRFGAAAKARRLGVDPRASRGRSPPSSRTRAPATAASTRPRRRRSWRRAVAPRRAGRDGRASWACCRQTR